MDFTPGPSRRPAPGASTECRCRGGTCDSPGAPAGRSPPAPSCRCTTSLTEAAGRRVGGRDGFEGASVCQAPREGGSGHCPCAGTRMARPPPGPASHPRACALSRLAPETVPRVRGRPGAKQEAEWRDRRRGISTVHSARQPRHLSLRSALLGSLVGVFISPLLCSSCPDPREQAPCVGQGQRASAQAAPTPAGSLIWCRWGQRGALFPDN